MFQRFKIFLITILIIGGLHLIIVDSVLEEGQSSKVTGALTRKTDPADSIFCKSDILNDVQMAEIYDPEYFVNLKLKHSKDETLRKYGELKHKTALGVQFEGLQLKSFVDDNFEEDKPKKCEEYQDHQNFEQTSSAISDEEYSNFHQTINRIWRDCAMQTDEDVVKNPESHSLLDVPACYIQVGNSNGMPTYWQNYLIVRGTLATGMKETAKEIMRNIVHLITEHGLALYSNKTYYSTRTQLPLLGLMVEDYLEVAEPDDIYLNTILLAVEVEFLWWFNNRKSNVQIEDKEYTVFLYNQQVNRARPENYKHDTDLASVLPSDKKRETFYANLYSLDESGFQYTNRFRTANPDGSLNLDIINIVPVELMSVLHKYATLLSTWFKSLTKIKSTPQKEELYKKKSETYSETAAEILKSITELLYNDEKGAWFDFHIEEKKQIEVYYLTNLLPLTTSSYDTKLSSYIGINAVNYLISEKILKKNSEPNYFVIPTSNERNGKIGDFPSGSLLLNVLIIEGLYKTTDISVKVVARELASVLVNTVYDGFQKYGSVWENYNAITRNYAAEYITSPPISPAAVGGINILMKRFGSYFVAEEYQNFQPEIDTKGDGSKERLNDSKSKAKIGESSGDAEDKSNKRSRTDAGV